MFKKITLQLSGPICTCDDMDLTWAIPIDDKNRPMLSFTCNKCKTKLTIPNEKFVGSFQLDTPYPGSKKKNTTENNNDVKIVEIKKKDIN